MLKVQTLIYSMWLEQKYDILISFKFDKKHKEFTHAVIHKSKYQMPKYQSLDHSNY